LTGAARPASLSDLRLEALLTIPAQQVGAFVSEAWGAFRRSSAYSSVPPLSPSLGLVGEALLDRTFTLMTSVMVGVPVPEAVRRMVEDLQAAQAFYGAQGWLAEPIGYHRTPPAPDEIENASARTFSGPRVYRYEHLRFESGWEPHAGEPGRERWLAHPLNGTAHVYVLRHEEPRPWLVGIHGFAMGTPLVNFAGFPVRMLHEELGLNLAFPVLPLHGPRGSGGMSGGEVLTPDYLRMVHLFAQAVWDVRRTLAWIRTQGDQPIGLHGISLGGYVSALVAGLEPELGCVIAGIPAVDFPSLANDNQPWIMRRYGDELEVDWRLVRRVSHVVSPLEFAPVVPRERRFIYAGLADRVVKPYQPRALWRHWGEPEIHWFSGGHVLGIWNPSIRGFLADALSETLCA
jgi:hypothetical protein